MPSSRQLAAIMFTDIVGYTALMGKDSAKALELVRISKDIQKPLVEKHNGKWLKEMGDGAMARFSTALDAVNCSIEIQEVARAKLDGKLRIGIHSGDITIEDDDVYGDGVNVASRLESIADPGGIYISESIEKAIQGQSDVQAKYLGEVKLKNVAYGVRTYALQGVGLPVPEVKAEKQVSGHFIAELKRRGVVRAGATYVVLSLLLILLAPYASSLVELPLWSTTALFTVLIVGFPIALYLAWNYERSPEGFVRTSSKESWQNPYKGSQKKPLTSNVIIAVMALIIIVTYAYPRYFSTEADTEVTVGDKSIAVMPFDNESADEENEYFVNGMMEDIRNNLSKIADLRVISKTSTEKYRTTTLSSQEIGKELSINYLLEGTVQKRGNQVRIHAQLISTENDDHIWEDTYQRDITDIKDYFIIQIEIAQAIADELQAVITPEEIELISSIPTENTEAYDLYLRGLFQSNSYTVEGYIQGLNFFQKAVELDSNFALAYSGIALSFLWRSSVFGDLSPDEASKNAMSNLNKALDLNPRLSEAHGFLGFVKFYFQWDFKGAEEEILKATMLNPNNETALFLYINFLNNMERHQEAFDYERKLMQIDPLANPDPTLFFLGRIDEAIQLAKKRVNLIPNPRTYSNLGFVLLNTGSYQEAINAQQKALELAGRRLPRMMAWLAAAYAKNGQEDKANELLDELKEIRNKSLAGSPSFFVAVIYSALDDKESAFQWLENAYEDHDMEMVWLKTEPQLYPLHDDSRFQDLLKRVGFDVSG